MKLLLNEIKHLVDRKFLLLLVIALLISLFTGIFVYKNSIFAGIIEENQYKEVFGQKAVDTVKSYDDKYYDYIDKNKLINAAKSHNENINPITKRSTPVYENLISGDISGLMYNFLYVNNKRKNPLVEWNDEAYIPKEVASNFYELRLEEVMYQAEQSNDLSIVNHVTKMENNLKKPFYVEKSASFWRT